MLERETDMIDGYWKILIDGKVVVDDWDEPLWFESEGHAWDYVEFLQDNGYFDPDTQHVEVYYYKRY